MIPLHRPVYENSQLNRENDLNRCQALLKEKIGAECLMTSSCTTALELSAMLLGAKPGDEVILPSFTFASTANAFLREGLVPVFVDIRRDTMNLDEKKIEAAITERTVAVVPMHYAGVACEMDTICSIAENYGIKVIEDAAQALFATYKDRPLGGIGHMGCVSFHETKNFSMGEGGALFLKDRTLWEQAEMRGECGTNRKAFQRNEITEYEWTTVGTSASPSKLACSVLYPQLLNREDILENRRNTWDYYYDALRHLEKEEKLVLPVVPEECKHNGHIFAIRTRTGSERDRLMTYLNERGIGAAFHYVPLHSSPAGRAFGRFCGEDMVTTEESRKLLRLPLYYGMEEEKYRVIEAVCDWFATEGGRQG